MNQQKTSEHELTPYEHDLLERIEIAARQHGENDDPRHETGDLLAVLETAFRIMTEEQVRTLEQTLRNEETLTEWTITQEESEGDDLPVAP